MKRHVRLVRLSTLLASASFTSTLPLLNSHGAYANTSASAAPSNTSDAPASAAARIEKVKAEIENIKGETDTTLKSITETQEINRCLGNVYSGLKALSQQIDSLSDRSSVASVANRTRDLVKKHAAFFDTLNDFSKQGLLLMGNPDLARAGENEEVSRIIEKASELTVNLRNEFRTQANEEMLFLADVSATMQRLQRAGASARRGLESAKQCAPHLIEKHTTLLDVGVKVLNNLEKARALISELQLKRSRILGSLTSGFQKKFAAQLAQASGQKADELVLRLNASLAELSLRTEIERWWFEESVENGAARGYLSGEKENALKAQETLRLAVANCDSFIARLKEVYANPAWAEQNKNKAIHSGLEIALYQRRAALSRWLEDASRSTTVSER